jgi:hypothetical protein
VVTDASAHFNNTDGFDGGTLVLAGDRAVYNGYGIAAFGVALRFSSCSIALNTTYSCFTNDGGTLAGTSPGTTLATGTAGATLASPSVLQ